MKREYEMTPQDLESLLQASVPVPMIMLQCGTPESPQERANRVWKSIGDRMGFDFMTVEPNGKGQMHFSAEPNNPQISAKI